MDTAATIHGALPCPGCGTPRRDESFREPCSACRAPGFTADLLVSVFGLGAGGGKVGMIVLGTILAGLVALTVAIATGRTGVDPKETDVFALLVGTLAFLVALWWISTVVRTVRAPSRGRLRSPEDAVLEITPDAVTVRALGRESIEIPRRSIIRLTDRPMNDRSTLLVMQAERIGFSAPRSFRLHHGNTDGFSLPIMILGDRTAREECVRAIERTLDMRVTAPSMPA